MVWWIILRNGGLSLLKFLYITFMLSGMFYLIPKLDGVVDDIKKWRLITTKNSGYNFYAEWNGLFDSKARWCGG